MPTRHILSAVFCAALPLLVLGASADDKPATKPVDKAAEAPKPAKLEAGKNFTEKTTGLKVEVVDPDADPPVTQKTAMKAQFEMVWVPGGEFMMGSPGAEKGREAIEGPAHKVKVKGFWMAKFECSWEEFDTYWFDENFFKADNIAVQKLGPDAVTRPTNAFVDATYGHPRDGHPALCMTHHSAMMYCQWLKKKTGRAYRLPTEAEWEYAARAGTSTPFAFGDTIAFPAQAVYAFTGDDPLEHGEAPNKALRFGQEVGKTKPNEFGLHDLHGNVAEWCGDWYKPEAYKDSPKLNPTGPADGDKRVIRGGSFRDPASGVRSAVRDGKRPTDRLETVGFRIVYAPVAK